MIGCANATPVVADAAFVRPHRRNIALPPTTGSSRMAGLPGITSRRLLVYLAAASVWLMLPTTVVATQVYRWVDDQGRVNYAEQVPERYRARAQPIKAPADNPSAEDQREALERAERLRSRDMPHVAARAAASAPASAAARSLPALRPAVKRPTQTPNEQTDCDTWQRLFLESSDCFGPYRTVRGGTRPEAFEVCNVVTEPPPRCRPRVP